MVGLGLELKSLVFKLSVSRKENQTEHLGENTKINQGNNKGCKNGRSSPIEVKCVGERGQETKLIQHAETDVCSSSLESSED